MKELEDHWQLLSQMIEEEHSNFHAFLETLREKSEWLNQVPYGLLWTDRGELREEENRV